MWAVWLLGFGCGARTNEGIAGSPPEAAPVAAEVPAAVPAEAPVGDARDRMVRALSSRDAGPTCAELDAMSSDPVADLTAIVETVAMPPAVPMRAANCLVVGHAAAAEATLLGWVVDPDTKGLALLVADRIDAMPPEIALRVAERALSGPHAATVRASLAAAKTPGIPALVGGQP